MGKRIWGSLDPFFEPGPVLGRRVANSKFFTALTRAAAFDEYHFFTHSKGAAEELLGNLSALYPDRAAEGRFKTFPRLELPFALRREDYHVFHLSDCMNYPFHVARLRNAFSREIFPITSVTHSLSYADHAGCFLKHLFAGTTARDAVATTSGPGRDVVAAYFDHLARTYALDAARFHPPRLAVIPLGIEPGDFAPPAPDERERARAALGVAPETIALLVFGRIDHASKMDLLPLFRAMSRVFQQGADKGAYCLILSGWIEDEEQGYLATLTELAANLGLRLIVKPRPTEVQKREVYAAADIFCSPADNPQETFGITLLEAQAMGLPVIASDFDGYRELVTPGVTGLLIPVTGPASTAIVDMLAPVSCDNHYHLLLAQRYAVDVPQLALAVAALAGDPGRRAAMGAAARAHALGFSWDAAIARYLALWEDLWRQDPGDRQALRAAVHPLHPPYARLFAGHPSGLLDASRRLIQSRAGRAVYRGQDFPVIYDTLSGFVDAARVRALLVLARNPVAAGALCEKLAAAEPDLPPELAEAAVLWALKHDLLEYAADGQP
jgi:glycosyltransferase involved in cell wall biosynthesis